MNDSTKPDDDLPKLSLAQENEFKRLKLKLESGAVLPDFTNTNIPPEVEGILLDNMFLFNTIYKNAPSISLYKRIGSPKYALVEDLSEDEIAIALDNLIALLSDSGIKFETLFEYSKSVIYEFITTEMFYFDIDDIRLTNIMMHFVYEDFCPNYVEDIKQDCKQFWDKFLKKQPIFIKTRVGKRIANNKDLLLFYESFAYFESVKNEHLNVVLNLKNRTAVAEVDLFFYGYLKGEKQPLIFEGTSTIDLIFKSGVWRIKNVGLVKN